MRYPISEVRLSTRAKPSRIICVSYNYLDYNKDVKQKNYGVPTHLTKAPTTLFGPDNLIIYRRIAQRVDYDGDFAVFIRDRIKDTPEVEA